MKLREPKCTCCDDSGKVLTATGVLRPCSRCNEQYHAWAKTYFVPQDPDRKALEQSQ